MEGVDSTTKQENNAKVVFPAQKKTRGRPKLKSDPIKHSCTSAISEETSLSEKYREMARRYVNKSSFDIYDFIKNPNENFHYRLANITKLNQYGFTRNYFGYEYALEEEKNELIEKSPDRIKRFGDLVLIRRPLELHNYIRQEKYKQANRPVELLKNAQKTKKISFEGDVMELTEASIQKYDESTSTLVNL